MNKRLAMAVLTAAVLGVPIASLAQPKPQNQSTPLVKSTPASAAADIPVKAVVLFSSGVGYFEHSGSVMGDGSTELRFKTSQINDILKSLVLQDLDGGKVSTITYPSQDPIAKTLKSFQVDITANPTVADLLNQLRGAKVTVANSNGESFGGVILGVEIHKKQIGDKGDTIDRPFLNLVSDGKILSTALDSVNSVKLDDPDLQEELNKALIALAGARDTDKKPVKINFTGQGERRVRIGYVVETPIWKTSYRLILQNTNDNKIVQDKSGNPNPTTDGKLQGWAIVENQTDNDWNDVQLSLVSGRPISFVEDLYQPLYVPRPVVEPELYASLRPQTYDAGMSGGSEMRAAGVGGVAGLPTGYGLQRDRQVGLQLAKSRMAARNGLATAGAIEPLADSGLPANKPMDVAASVSSLASASEVGELFQYTVGNVSLARQRSAMIPIITDPIQAERVSIYNPNVLPRNPLNGAKIKNTTGKHLLAGPVTVIDGATYAGDAQVDNVPPGQERLLSYGVDLQMLIDAKDNHQETNIQTGKIVKGILYVSNKTVRTQNYIAENKADHDKALIIEHPRTGGWDLVDTDKPIETTDAVYRFRENAPAGQKVSLKVTEQVVNNQEIALLGVDSSQLEIYRTNGAIPKPVQDALGKAAQLKQTLVDTQRQIELSKGKLNDITAEQNRIRENMKTVTQSSEYYTRLMKKLNDQETLIEKTQGELDDLQKSLESEQAALESYLSNLNVG